MSGATLTDQLDALIAEHGLASIGIGRIARSDRSGNFWSINVQAEMPNGERAIGTNKLEGDAPGEALAVAIDALNAKRFAGAVVPELEAA